MSRNRINATAVVAALSAAGFAAGAEPCGMFSVVYSPNPGSGNHGLGGVTATAPDDVWAFGLSGIGPFLLRWNGGEWVEQAYPSELDEFTQGWEFRAIGSFAPNRVWQAGIVVTSTWTTEQALLEWNGSGWEQLERIELLPSPVYPYAPRYGSPRDIDGTGPDNIWFVGTASGWGDGRSGGVPMVMQWDGSELIEHNGQLLIGNRQNHFYGVAVLAPDDVWAVGYYNNTGGGGGFHSMIQHWDGSSWTRVQHPTEADPQMFLHDIVAIAPDDIWAVGEMPGGALLLHWDGTRWTLAESPTNVTTRIAKVEAFASDDVWATTYFEPGYLHWDGASWTVMGANEVPGAVSVNRGGGLAVAGACDMWSVGGFTEDGWNSTLTERLQVGGGPTGDANGDGVVDFQDVLAVLAAWGPCTGECPADVDGNGVVNFGDLLIVLATWT